MTAAVSAPGALRLSIDGSGDVVWTGLDSERVEIGVSGSGDVEVSGKTGALAIELNGSGNVDAGDLDARDVPVAIAGSGDVDVSVSDTLAAEISGSGQVTYSATSRLRPTSPDRARSSRAEDSARPRAVVSSAGCEWRWWLSG